MVGELVRGERAASIDIFMFNVLPSLKVVACGIIVSIPNINKVVCQWSRLIDRTKQPNTGVVQT